MPETTRRSPVWSVPVRLAPLACCLALLAGCATDTNNRLPNGRATYDPLLGGPAMPQANAAAPPAPTPVAGAATTTAGAPQPALPPLPYSGSSKSPAALASGTSQPLDGAHDPLRISDPAGAWRGQGPQVTLNPPQLGKDPVTPPGMPLPASAVAAPGITLTGGARAVTYEQAEAQLAARNVQWQRLDMTGPNGEWQFSCSVPNRQNPSLSRTYEAKAADPVSALRAVLDQMDK